MPNTNGHVRKLAIPYARVSTEEQARSGYSLAQQLEACRRWCATEGYEILEEVTDPGQSGASLERPGMDRVRDIVARVGSDDAVHLVVLAQDRDRFAREPAYLYLLREEFAENGTKIRALNDHGDESPEGQLTDGILDQIARYERMKIAERSRRGKIAKAKEGKIIASRLPTYGFAYNEARDGYVVDEATMVYVRRIFAAVALEGSSINAIKVAFDREGVPTPAGAPYWSHKAIRDIIFDDCYKAHTFEEVRALVGGGAAVLSRLERDKRYGIWYFGRRKTKTRQVSERAADGSVLYRKKQLVEGNPKSEWVAVPIVDSIVPREWVDAARAAINANSRPAPTSGDRQWPLSGSVFVCEGCGAP